MKRAIIILMLIQSTLLFGQRNTFDTVVFLRGGKAWQVITYGNDDSLTVNGITYRISAIARETDPVYTAERIQYYTRTVSDQRYIQPSVSATITGDKFFNSGKLIINGQSGGMYTRLKSLATGEPDTEFEISFPAKSGTVSLTSDLPGFQRYSVYSSGNTNVEVLADSAGVTASFANSNELTFYIPPGRRILSAKIRLSTGFSQLKVFLGENDMTNTAASNRWMPITQAWREDTGAQLMGITTTMDLFTFDKFTINGLINTTPNLIRLSF